MAGSGQGSWGLGAVGQVRRADLTSGGWPNRPKEGGWGLRWEFPGELRERCRSPLRTGCVAGFPSSGSGRSRRTAPARLLRGRRPDSGQRALPTAADLARGIRAAARRFPEVLENAGDQGRIGNEGDDSHRGPTVRTDQWKHLVDSRQQHRPGGEVAYNRCTVSAARSSVLAPELPGGRQQCNN